MSEQISPKFLIIPDEAAKEVRALTALSADQLRRLDRALSSRTVARRPQSVIAKELAISGEASVDIFSAISNLRRQRQRFRLTDAQMLEDLTPFAEGLDAARGTALLELLGKTDEDYFVEKASSLRHALGAHYIGSKTL